MYAEFSVSIGLIHLLFKNEVRPDGLPKFPFDCSLTLLVHSFYHQITSYFSTCSPNECFDIANKGPSTVVPCWK